MTATWTLPPELKRTVTRAHQKLIDPKHHTFGRWLDDGLWIGLFPHAANVSAIPEIVWPATGPLTATSPWRFIALDEVQGDSFCWSMDSKVRGDMDFVLFSNGYDLPVEEARATLTVTDAKAPGQVRLARTDVVTQMRVQWNEASAAIAGWPDSKSTVGITSVAYASGSVQKSSNACSTLPSV